MDRDERAKLGKLIAENPDLPIYAWVDTDVCSGEWSYCLGNVDYATVDTILDDARYEQVFTDAEEFKQYYYDEHEDEFEGLSEVEVEERLEEICVNQPWKRVILLTIGLPEV